MKTFIIIAICIILFIFFIIYQNGKKFIIDRFSKGNCIVFGEKGHGKDLFFQYVISIRYKKLKKNDICQLSNIDYGYKTKIESVKRLSDLGGNTYENMINGNITKIDKHHEYEGKDYYLSDAGIYFPCQYDFLLDKVYKSFPVFYATSRHTYSLNFHMNTQALERPWKKIREQADSYFYIKNRIKLLFGIIILSRYYQKYQSAVDRLEPLQSRTLNKYSKAEVDLYNAKNGKIKNLISYLPKSHIYYDTRIFETIFFNNIEHKTKKFKDKKLIKKGIKIN